jgi:hypothetical protein
MVYGELGRYPIDIDIKVRTISYWARLLSGKQAKFSNVFYRLSRNLNAISKLANVMEDDDTGSITDINQMTKQFTDSVIDTATSCVKYKLNKKLNNKNKRKQEWFSNNCELMRKDVRRLGKKVQNNPYNYDLKMN